MPSASEMARQDEEQDVLLLVRTPADIVADIEAAEQLAEKGWNQFNAQTNRADELKKELQEVSRG